VSYLLLQHGASLAWADTRCGSACVCVRQGNLHFSDGHACDRLVPGRILRAGSLTFQVFDTQST
jgi:hypothetical protein